MNAWRHRLNPGLAVLLCLFATTARAGAQLPPNLDYHTLQSDHFRVTFAPGLEATARRTIAVAEDAFDYLVRTLSAPPAATIDIVLVDNVDFSNGYATPFPSNRVVIYARPPAEDEALGYSPGWIDLVVAHELTHIFQLDRAGKAGRALRSVFGRVPLWYPMFPLVGTPEWNSEGLATVVESGFTGMGRARGSNHDMIVRTAVLEDRFDRMDRLNEDSPIWPGNQRWYIYGSLFLDWLGERFGDDVHDRLLDNAAGAILPPMLFFDRVARRTIGLSFDEAFAAWRVDLDRRYRVLADSLTARGLTVTERISTDGRWAIHPRVSPDGSRLAWAAEDGRSVVRTRVLDLNTMEVSAEYRRNGLGALSWTPDGAIVFSQLEFDGPYRLLRDLYAVVTGERRLTWQARLEDPDASQGEARVLAVQQSDGMNRLVRADVSTGEVRPITDFEPGTLWAFPRWSPDGSRIAVSRWRTGGEYDVLVLDDTGRTLARLTHDAALDMAPAWSPDGRHVLFSSDRSGIPNLFAADVSAIDTPVLKQVTNVLTGAFFPEVSPDGRWLYFSVYHADGYAIERIAFDPAAWLDPSPLRLEPGSPAAESGRSRAASEVERSASAAAAPPGSEVVNARPWSPWRSLLPKAWLPFIFDGGRAGTFLGGSATGTDLVGRNSASLWAGFDVDGSGRWEGYGRWAWAGLGNPVLSFEAGRTWDDLGDVVLPDSTRSAVIESEDVVGLFATILRRRYRNSASLSLGLEREVQARHLLDTDQFQLRDARDPLFNVVARLSFSSARYPALAISPEDGIALIGTARWTAERNGNPDFPRDKAEYKLRASLYRSLPLPGFAHHVLAAQANAFVGTGDGTGIERIGGTSGGGANLAGYHVTTESRLLPLRGFDAGVLRGNRAWTASAEYRIPVALVGRRPALSPFFVDRVSAAAFIDAGDAWCIGRPATIWSACQTADAVEGPLLGAGAELVLDLGFAGIAALRGRLGFAAPLRGPVGGDGPTGGARMYVQLGSNY